MAAYLLCLIFLFLSLCGMSLANDFSTGVFATASSSTVDDIARSIIIQSDGRIVLGGRTTDGSNDTFALVRHFGDGVLDTEFETISNGIAHALAIDSQSRVLALGRREVSPSFDFRIARFTTTGRLDTAFNTTGYVELDFGVLADFGRAVLVQSDDKVITAGYSRYGNDYLFSLARFNTNGSLDNTFGTSGRVVQPVAGNDDVLYAAVLATDGKVIVAGSAHNGSNEDFAVARFNTDGTLDNTLNGSGTRFDPVGTGRDVPFAIALELGGKIVLGGRAHNGSNYDFAVVRYNTDGSIDTTFSNDGKVLTPITSSGADIIRAIAVDDDNKVLAIGRSYDTNSWDVALARYASDGTLDPSFHSDGMVVHSVEQEKEDLALAVDFNDGRIFVGGRVRNASNLDMMVARFQTNGEFAKASDLDLTFGLDGKVEVDIGSSSADAGRFISEDSQGRIVVVGESVNDFAIIRLDSKGIIDTTFSGDGKVTLNIGTDDVQSGLIDDNDRIFAVGGDGNDFAVAKFLTNGSADNSFSGDGQIQTDVGAATTDVAYQIIAQSDGKPIIVGDAGNDFGVVRYNTDGSMDTTFSGDGRLTTDIGTGSTDAANGVAIDSGGRIIVVGVSANDFAIVRYLTSGIIDTTFHSDGKHTFSVGTTDSANDIKLDPQGKLLVFGTSDSDFALARFNTDGSLDTLFGTNGTIETDIGSASTDDGRSLIVTQSGKIIAVGTSANDFAIHRYLSNGTIDYTFSRDGVRTYTTGTDVGDVISLQADERILVGGTADNDFTALRLYP